MAIVPVQKPIQPEDWSPADIQCPLCKGIYSLDREDLIPFESDIYGVGGKTVCCFCNAVYLLLDLPYFVKLQFIKRLEDEKKTTALVKVDCGMTPMRLPIENQALERFDPGDPMPQSLIWALAFSFLTFLVATANVISSVSLS